MDDTNKTNKYIKFIHKHSFFVFISASILIAIAVTSISMTLYNISGAAQLDLSRPGYKDVRGQIEIESSSFQSFSPVGSINSKVINDYIVVYKEYSTKLKTVDAFGGDPLNPIELGIGPVSAIE